MKSSRGEEEEGMKRLDEGKPFAVGSAKDGKIKIFHFSVFFFFVTVSQR